MKRLVQYKPVLIPERKRTAAQDLAIEFGLTLLDHPAREYDVILSFSIELDKKSSEHNSLVTKLKALGISLDEAYTRSEWAGEELQESVYLYLTAREYSLCYHLASVYEEKESCPCCGRGAKQSSNLIEDYFFFRRKDFAETALGGVVFSRKLKDAIEKNKFSGGKFLELFDRKQEKQTKYDYYQMFFDNLLPPMAKGDHISVSRKGRCRQCGGRMHTLRDDAVPTYKIEDQKSFSDFNVTYETFGLPGKAVKPESHGDGSRLVIVSNEVYRCFVKLKARNCVWRPVRFIE